MFERIVRVHLYKIVLIGLVLSTAVCIWLFWKTQSPQWAALLGGTATGLIVAVVQYLIQWNEHSDIEAFKRLAIRRILPYREGKLYYEQLIEKATREIAILGNTASRFLDDFANAERGDTQALIHALHRGVSVRLLLPKPEFLNQQDQHRGAIAGPKLAELAAAHPKFLFRYFSHKPAHSLVRIDDECLVGPIFSHVASKNSPAIHTLASSPFVVHYINHFEEEWQNAQ